MSNNLVVTLPTPVQIEPLGEAARTALREVLNVADAPSVSFLVRAREGVRPPRNRRERELRDDGSAAYGVTVEGDPEVITWVFPHDPLSAPAGDDGWWVPNPWEQDPYASLGPARIPVALAVSGAVGLAIARASGGIIEDIAAHWVDPGPGDVVHTPEEFLEAFRLRSPQKDFHAATRALWDEHGRRREKYLTRD